LNTCSVGVEWAPREARPLNDGAILKRVTDPRTRLGDEGEAIRKARNEIQLRKLNERIEEDRLRVGPTLAEWICECWDETCGLPVKLTIAEYEAVRAEPTHFFIAPSEEHLSTDIEYVVRQEPRYWVIAKKGVGAEMSLREQDPRRW
jgi:hypothetical protein